MGSSQTFLFFTKQHLAYGTLVTSEIGRLGSLGPASHVVPLAAVTQNSLNFIAYNPQRASNTRKRVSNSDQDTRNVRSRTSSDKENITATASTINPTQTASIAGAGPIPSNSSPAGDACVPPALLAGIFRSFEEKRQNSESKKLATDIWHFILPSPIARIPHFGDDEKHRTEKPPVEEAEFLACRLCEQGATRPKAGIWKNATGGLTKNIRNHLTTKHSEKFEDAVKTLGLKGADLMNATDRPSARRKPGEPFNSERFLSLLIRWIVVDDQSINVVECQEFRDVLEYIGVDLKDGAIPHRTHLLELIFGQFETCFKNTREEMNRSLGRISFTSDMWSRGNLQGYMAITAHYIIREHGHLILKSCLIAFRHVQGSHDGESMATHFLGVLDEYGIANRTGLARLNVFELDDDDGVTSDEIYEQNPPAPKIRIPAEYLAALEKDVISCVRKLVNACRASGKRRDGLRQILIDKLREAEAAFQAANPHLQGTGASSDTRVVVLLRDVDTRWSSIYLMVDRLLELYPSVKKFALQPGNEEIKDLLLSDWELSVLNDIRIVLHSFHMIQQLVSAEKTPTLAIVLPLYEQLTSNLKKIQTKLPYLSHMIESSLQKIYEYVGKSRATHEYAFAMAINPTCKLTWIESQWSAEDSGKAKSALIEVLREHQTALRHDAEKAALGASTSRPASDTRNHHNGSNAAYAQSVGLANLDAFTKSLDSLTHTHSLSSLSTDADTSTNSENELDSLESELDVDVSPHDTLSDEERENQAILGDEVIVKEELQNWIAAGIVPRSEVKDLIKYWDNDQLQTKFPTLFRLALDVLPVQASAVPCERAFSSSKQTDTDHRSRLSPIMMEVLQILKAIYHDDRLDFTKSWVAKSSEMEETEEEVTVNLEEAIGVSMDEPFREMLLQGQFADLARLIHHSDNM
ncbi:hypothetical protein D9758_008518 [Tetrapyrgos nigripes]|uniref:HAT C-terminal dimerisation domain-containing protein n=1 Tax=Tetrapyrgos nigripes TaxID=182062 RepID=A0A8H5LIN3_9AGAR|nr:hypothetical protein D9758_008518 [Tetrapyrgos nigripes]